DTTRAPVLCENNPPDVLCNVPRKVLGKLRHGEDRYRRPDRGLHTELPQEPPPQVALEEQHAALDRRRRQRGRNGGAVPPQGEDGAPMATDQRDEVQRAEQAERNPEQLTNPRGHRRDAVIRYPVPSSRFLKISWRRAQSFRIPTPTRLLCKG